MVVHFAIRSEWEGKNGKRKLTKPSTLMHNFLSKNYNITSLVYHSLTLVYQVTIVFR